MIKKIFLLLAFFALTGNFVIGQNLYIVKIENNSESYFKNDDFSVHYFNDQFLIGSGIIDNNDNVTILENETWKKDFDYHLVWLPEILASPYVSKVEAVSEILFKGDEYLIIKTAKKNISKLRPAIHNGLVKLNICVASML